MIITPEFFQDITDKKELKSRLEIESLQDNEIVTDDDVFNFVSEAYQKTIGWKPIQFPTMMLKTKSS